MRHLESEKRTIAFLLGGPTFFGPIFVESLEQTDTLWV